MSPDTVLRWHRKGFQYYWTRESRRGRLGRPALHPDIRRLIRDMSRANPLWGAPRIHGELLKLGIKTSQATVTTATFRLLFVLVVLRHDRRRVVHFNVTDHPSASWTAQRLIEAFPWDAPPRYLLRDRDGVYGAAFQRSATSLGLNEVLTAPRSPWQGPFAERLIGSVRRDCLDHVIVLGQRHLRRLLTEYFSYYTHCRTHLALAKDTPKPRQVNPPSTGEVIALPRVGGLHHRYTHLAA